MDRGFGLFALFLAMSFVVGISWPAAPAAAVKQPIQFNHTKHVKKMSCFECHFICEDNRDEDGEIDCEDCLAADGPFCDVHIACPDHRLPGVPQTEQCLRCHESDLLALSESTPAQDGSESARAKRVLLDYITFDEIGDVAEVRPIPWQRVTMLPSSHVYFSHRTHAAVLGIDCATCHGDVATMETPPERPAITMGMDWCLECHEREQATSDCASCHR